MWSNGYGMMGGWGGGFSLVHGLFWLALLGVIGWAAIAAVRQFSDAPRNDRREYGRSRALEMLEQAYAKGSIGRDEFMQKKQDLEA